MNHVKEHVTMNKATSRGAKYPTIAKARSNDKRKEISHTIRTLAREMNSVLDRARRLNIRIALEIETPTELDGTPWGVDVYQYPFVNGKKSAIVEWAARVRTVEVKCQTGRI